MEAKALTCIGCPMGCQLSVKYEMVNGSVDKDSIQVSGNTCPRGQSYAISEITNPTRTVTGTVSVANREGTVVSVKTDNPVPKDKVFDVSREMFKIEAVAPLRIGDVVCENISGTGCNLIITKNID